MTARILVGGVGVGLFMFGLSGILTSSMMFMVQGDLLMVWFAEIFGLIGGGRLAYLMFGGGDS